MLKFDLYNKDCIEVLTKLPDASVDMILCDPPYATTEIKWDSPLPWDSVWVELKRIIKDNGAIVLTAAQPFTSELVTSGKDIFKYSLVWKKTKVSHFAQAPYRFLSEHEDILVFSKGGTAKNAKNRMKYNPQGLVDCNKVMKGKGASAHRPNRKQQDEYTQTKTGYPKSILEFNSVIGKLHPTEKPVELMKYLIESYSDENDTILDFTAGSFSTGVAAMQSNRNFIGIELDPTYYKNGVKRLKDYSKENSKQVIFKK